MKVGIMGAGKIAGVLAGTLAQMENAVCFAVASRSLERARAFAAQFGCERAYGSYEELARDADVDLIYVATPHSEHLANARLCLEHGKPVLCEKAFTANAKQAQELFDLAREKNVFITEAIWTRYMPFLATMREVLASGVIGRPTLLTANLSYPIDDKERMQSPALAGGALLDVGVYTIHFALMLLGTRVRDVRAVCTHTKTGVDEQNSVTLLFEDGAMAVLNSSMLGVGDRLGIIQGTKGFAVVENINNFETMTVYDMNRAKIAEYRRPPQLTGYEYEVEACRAAIAAQKIECEAIPHEETLRVMRIMDAARSQCGIRYPFE